MATVRFKAQFNKTGQILRDVDKRFKRAKDLSPVLENKVVGLIRQSVAEEFASESWKSPGGGVIAWDELSDKYVRDERNGSAHPILYLSGQMFGAWMGHGSEHHSPIEIVTAKTVQVGIESDFAEVHRGGTGSEISSSPIWNNIPPRPHGTHNPSLDTKVSEAILNYIAFGDD